MAKAWYATTKKNPNKPHVCRYTVPDASAPKSVRQHEEGYATREEAYRAVFAMQQRIDSGEFEAKQYTFGEAIWHWLDTRHIKAVTRRQYRIDINAHLTGYMDKPLREVSQMRRELTDLLNTLCPSAAQNMRVIISGTCDLAMAEGEIPGHRLGMLEIPLMIKRESPLIPHTVKQLNIMLDTVPDNLRLYILLMRGCGLRDGEARAMETDAIHDGYLEVKRATTMGVDGLPKMRREGFIPRRVPIPHWLQPLIDEHIAKYAKDGVLFPSIRCHNSRYVSQQYVLRNFQAAAKKAGLPTGGTRLDSFTSHQLRKHWATQMRNESRALGIGFEDIEQWIGHKNLTRDTYAFQSDDVIERGRNLSDPRKES